MGQVTTVVEIARVCHETNRAWCAVLGDDSQKAWEEAPDWQRQSAIEGVRYALSNPEAPDSALHENWMRQKEVAGWAYGAVKSESLRTHPCLVPFSALPPEQQAKDRLFFAIVRALGPAVALEGGA